MLSSAQVMEAEDLSTEPPLPEPETKIEAILRRIAEKLRDIERNGNHGEIVIRVVAGRVKISGGAEIEIR